ncbi:MAG: aminotransferase class V-fold PLP-dependent enzyme [Planctomycetota bacterium]
MDDFNDSAALLRGQMPVVEKYAYFDHAAVAPLPRATASAIQKYAQTASMHGDARWLDWRNELESLRNDLAAMLRCQAKEICLLNNTTHGINLVAEGVRWRPGDNVVVPDNEFPSNMIPWQNLRRLGVEVRQVKTSAGGVVSADSMRPYMDSKTKLVAASWVGFATGFRLDPSPIAQLAHEYNALFLLDAIQGLGAFPLDVSASGVDFVVADGHKWLLGPEGAGFMFARQAALERLQPIGLGWSSLASGAFDLEPGAMLLDSIKQDASRYEAGTYNMGGMQGFAQSIRLLSECGVSEGTLAQSILANVSELTGQLNRIGVDVHVPAREQERSGIVGASWADCTAGDKSLRAAWKWLLQRQVVTSVRAGRMRIATHAYNSTEEIERLATELSAFLSA